MKDRNYLPFDLEAAKAGRPVMTRKGDKVDFITCDLDKTNWPIAAIITDRETGCQQVRSYLRNGRAYSYSALDPYDLVMEVLDTDIIKWIILYQEKGGEIKCGNSLFDTKEEAAQAISEFWNKTEVSTVPLNHPICTTPVRVQMVEVCKTNEGDRYNR